MKGGDIMQECTVVSRRLTLVIHISLAYYERLFNSFHEQFRKRDFQNGGMPTSSIGRCDPIKGNQMEIELSVSFDKDAELRGFLKEFCDKYELQLKGIVVNLPNSPEHDSFDLPDDPQDGAK